LRQAGAVAHVNKDHVAKIATAIDPAHQHNLLPGVFRAQLSAPVRATKIT
jgi:hypothetical protein